MQPPENGLCYLLFDQASGSRVHAYSSSTLTIMVLPVFRQYPFYQYRCTTTLASMPTSTEGYTLFCYGLEIPTYFLGKVWGMRLPGVLVTAVSSLA